MLGFGFAMLSISVVWGLWWWLELPLWIAIVATVIIVMVLVTIVLWKTIKARRGADELEKRLVDQATDMRSDIEAMQKEFHMAVRALEGSKLGKRALVALPWYLIIGPPGVGKTTALRNSGLQFPYVSDRQGGAVRGIGGTRNCDWWMTNRAIIVDTAGRYTSGDEDRDEWLAFLDLLGETRPQRPINGILLAISVSDLALARADEIRVMAEKIRARIDEVTSRLEMSVPVYVLFTKCDLLPGFVEMYAELGKTERAGIWGFTLPVLDGRSTRDPIDVFAHHFDRLAHRNEQRAFRRLGEERELDARGKIYAFPQHFELLRDNLAHFVGQVFTANVYTETPLLRGCYFISGTQVGRAIDTTSSELSRVFGVQPQARLGQQQTETRSYFLGNLFNQVIFADRELAGRTAEHSRRTRLMRWSAAFGVFATALGLTILPIRSVRQNQRLLAEIAEAGKEIEEHEADRAAALIPLDRIAPLHAVEEELRGYETERKPLAVRWGMYQGAHLYPETARTFGRVGREELIIPLMASRIAELRRFTARYADSQDEPPAEEATENFDILRMYLLLAGDLGEYRNQLDEGVLAEARVDEDTWLSSRIARGWAHDLFVTDELAAAEMKKIAASWIRVLREHPELELELDVDLVERARAVLERSDRIEIWLAELIREAAEIEGVRDIGLRDMITTRFYQNDGTRVRGAFTRIGWERYARSHLARPPGEFVGSEWVLGLTEEETRLRQQLQRLRLRSRYFEQYMQEWHTFVSKIYIDTSGDLHESLTMFQELSRGANPPLEALLVNVAHNAVLEDEALESGEKPWFHTDNLPEVVKRELRKGRGGHEQTLYFENRDVLAHFEQFIAFGVPPRPLPGEAPPTPVLEIAAYQEQLQLVRDAMQAAIDDPTKLHELGVRLEASITVVKGQVAGQYETWRPRFDALLLPPFEAAQQVIERSESKAIGEAWCSAVYFPWQQAVASKYPFDPEGYDMPLSEFREWFEPDAGPVGEFTKNSSSKLRYHPRLPPFLTAVGDIGSIMFPPGSDGPKFEFDVQIEGTSDVSEITLSVDGTEVSYRGGPQKWTRMIWPGEGEPGAMISAEGFGGRSGDVRSEGEWGLWRLLGEATVSGVAGQRVYTIRWNLADQDIGVLTIQLRPTRSATPLFGVPSRGSKEYLGLFAGIEAPRSVAAGHVCKTAP